MANGCGRPFWTAAIHEMSWFVKHHFSLIPGAPGNHLQHQANGFCITIQLMIFSWDHPGIILDGFYIFHRIAMIIAWRLQAESRLWLWVKPRVPEPKTPVFLGIYGSYFFHLPPQKCVVCRRFWTILIHPHLSLTPGKRPTDRWRFRLFQCALGAPAVGPNEVSLPGMEQNWNKLKFYHGLHR